MGKRRENQVRRKTQYIVGALVAGVFFVAGAAADEAPANATSQARVLVMGSGPVNGTYYPAAGAVCRVVNKEKESHGLRCLVETGSGSGANIQGLRDGSLDLAIVQSQAQYQAYKGEGVFKDAGPFPELRTLLSLHGEAIAIVVGKDSGIKTLEQLKGKRINLGHPGSFQRTMADLVIEAFGWTEKSFSHALEIEPGDVGRALCDGQVDAVFLTGVQPQEEMQAMLTECGGKVLAVEGKAIDALLEKTPYLSRTVIPAALYTGQDEDIATIGVTATLVTTTKLPDTAAYEIVKEVVENFTPLMEMHQALSTIDQEQIGTAGLSAPLHDGAARYFREKKQEKASE